MIDNHEKIFGQIKAPPSKSYMQRALVLAALSDSPTKIYNPAFDSDSLAAIKLIENLSCKINYQTDFIEISPDEIKLKESHILNCGESGLLMRMIAPVLSIYPTEFLLLAEGSLNNRELYEIREILEQLGAKVETNNNFPPIKIKGPIHSGEINLLADKTSQFLTGLLVALPKLKEKSIITVENLSSRPYIDITIELVRQFGGEVEWIDENRIEISPSNYSGQVIRIEGDWSNSAVYLIAGAIAGEVTVSGLNPNSLQGDKAILEVLEQVGAIIECHSEQSEESRLLDVIPAKAGILGEHPLTPSFQEGRKSALSFLRMQESETIDEYMDSSVASLPLNDNLSSITVKKNNLFPFDFDAKDTPDLVPYLAILAANCKGKSMIHNVTRLNLKESRRLDLIMKNLSQMSINCELKNDTLEIWSGKIQGGIFETGNDHRMSMAGALASLTSSMEIIIDNQDCVKKSYPYFWNDIKSVSKKLY